MFKNMKFILISNILLLSTVINIVQCDYDRQPKIRLNGGNLILESAYDRNISVRLSRDSSLYLNNVDVMEKIRQRYTPPNTLDGDTKQLEIPSSEQLKDQVQKLHIDLENFANRLIASQNRTRRTLQLGVIRRNLGRIRRLSGRLIALERNLKKDECVEATEPCKNGGTCYDSYNNFHCECTEGYTGKTCEEDVDECYMLAGTDLGCQNNAICTNTPGSYKCTCAKGFTGTHCRLRNAICQQAQSQEICAHGTCVPANNAQGYACICEQGWINNRTTTNATNIASLACDIDVNECEDNTNPCHSECINLPGSFKCGPCPVGYSGNGFTCLDVDECAINNGGCSLLPKVRCINTEGSYHCGNCPPGWLGDGHICELAPSSSCNSENICHPQAKCEYISDIATCTCPPGMFGHGFGPQGCHTNPIIDSCENHICQHNGTCLSTGRSTSCLCPSGYSGALCETVDGCHPNPCENGGSCRPLAEQSFKCSCLPGTTGKRCEVLRNVCAKTMRRPEGELKYPTDDSSEYSINERCAWIIRTNPSEILNLTFTSFDVEDTAECNHDWLQIHDGNGLASQLIGRFCGNQLPLGGTILSSQNLLFFWFRSDNATNRPGFQMTWVSQPHVCGETLELNIGDAGVVRSPGYPGKTPKNRECQWDLSAPYGYRFVIRIYEVTLGTRPNCTGDTLKIYDADLLLKEYCQTTNPEPLRSSSNKLLLHFHTDSFSLDSSFQLHYEVESGVPHCGGLFTEPSGLIVGPTDQSVCLYLIQQPPGIQVKWEFLDMKPFQVENCNLKSIERKKTPNEILLRSADHNLLGTPITFQEKIFMSDSEISQKIFDGQTDKNSTILMTCSGKKPEPIISTSNFMLIRYRNTLKDEQDNVPFRAKYSRACEFRVFGPDSGVLMTPNYPKPYTEYITCTFHIYGPAGNRVSVNFTDFSISETTTYVPNDIIMNLTNNGTAVSDLNDDDKTYVDVYVSKTNKRRYYKGTPMSLKSQLNVMTIVFHATTNMAKARGLRIDYDFLPLYCGGIYTENRGYIHKYMLSIEECTYILEAPEGRHIKLSLEYFSPSSTPLGRLLLFANTTAGQDFTLLNSTSDINIDQIFNFNVLTLTVRPSFAMLRLSYSFVNSEELCSGNFSTLYGVVSSPSWPASYKPNLDCVWIITAPMGKKIELKVNNFELEPTCSGDVLEIRNGQFASSPLIGRYCGNQIPSRIPSFTNNLYLRFKTDNYIEGSGFSINWEQTTTGCGGKLTSYKGSIHSPHIDDSSEYKNMQVTCDWQIIVAQGSTIDLIITPSIDQLEFCRNNHLQIYDGPSTLNSPLLFNCTNVFKGQTLQVKSSTNQVLIIYTLTENSRYTQPEFVLDYISNCNVVIDNSRGIIESPNFPEYYPENQNCIWDIKAGRNNKIQLAFSHLSLEAENMECEYDYVEIWDMKDLDVLKKTHLCAELPDPMTSEGNHLQIHFVTDYSNARNGFRAEYSRLGCGSLFEKEFGSFGSPNYPYSSDLDCDWYIEVAAGRQIVLTVTEFHIESDNPDCQRDVLLIKETKNSSIELAKECQMQQIPVTVTSPSNRLYLHFHTSSIRSRKYFKAFYHTRQATCGGTIRGLSGWITSPNYPYGSNTENIDCVWDLTIPESYGFVLDFKEFNLTQSNNCTEASLKLSKVSVGNPIYLETFCGTERPSKKIIHGSRLKVEYKDKAVHGVGGKFAMEFRKECGGLITQPSGIIKSLANEECIWEFDVPQNTLISINILQLDCYCKKNNKDGKNCENGLGFKENLFDDEEGNYTVYLCEEHQSNLVFEVSQLHIYANNINFRAQYSTVEHSCGGTLSSPRGSLASPYYPSTYPSNIECTWMLLATKGSFIKLQFDQLDIAKSEHCNEDYIEIREWSESKVLGLYCGKQMPEETLVSFERFWLRFHSSEGSTGNGFKLSWNYAHLNEIVNKTSGNIASPPLKMIQNDEDPYAWRILVERGQYVLLEFEQYNSGLTLYDGFDDTALAVEISQSPWRFISSSNVVYLNTENANLEYFNIRWRTNTNKSIAANSTLRTCHSEESIKVHNFNAIKIESPGYPQGYNNNLHCDWIFKPTNPTEHVVLDLYVVDLETTGSCTADYLKISTSADLENWHKEEQICNGTAGSIEIPSLMPKNFPPPFKRIHGTPNIKMDFVTDVSINRTGFAAKVLAQCGSNMTDSVGFINNLIFDYYLGRRDSNCIWHIHVKPGKRIRLQLDYLTAVSSPKYDWNTDCKIYAIIYDGIDEHAPILSPGKLCYPQNVTTIRMNSSTNHLTIKYKLDSFQFVSSDMNFWNLTYREYSECNEEIRLIPEASVVNITSPNYPNVPNPHTDCEWRIVAPQGDIIQVEFLERFDMNTRYCAKEFLELFDGSTMLARSLGRYCRKPPNIKTTQNILNMHYLSDITEPRNGFKARISISKCGGSFSENHGLIKSPGYPGSYPSSTQCDFAINLLPKGQIRLEITDLHLPYDAEKLKTTDYLEIITIDGDDANVEPTFIYGNATAGTQYQIASSKAIIRFHTFMRTTQYRGFTLKYNSQGNYCHHDITGVSGLITMSFPTKSHFMNTCSWKIRVPKKQRVRLEFLNMDDMKDYNSTSLLRFSLHNNFDYSSAFLSFTPNTFDSNAIIQSTDNFLQIRAVVPRGDMKLKTLKARYTSTEESPCPADINEETPSAGIIDIRDTQPVFNGNYYCNLQIKLNGQESLIFNITAVFIFNRTFITNPLVLKDAYFNIPIRVNLTQAIRGLSQETGGVTIVQNENVRINHLQITYKKYPCGGLIKVNDGVTFNQTQFGSGLNINEPIVCVWTLVKPYSLSGFNNNPDFKLFGNFTFTDTCDNEFIQIYNGQWDEKEPKLKICQDNKERINELIIDNRKTFIIYQTKNYIPQKLQFSMNIKKNIKCGSETMVNLASSLIQIDKTTYRNNQECSWIFYTQPGLYLQLKFVDRFFIENSANCTKDYLEIQRYDAGIWLTEDRLCGRESPGLYNVTSNRMQVIFRTDNGTIGEGFTFFVKTHCTLNINVTSTEPQVIVSPPMNMGTYRQMHCEYTFQGNDSDKLINIRTKFANSQLVYSINSCRLGTLNVFKHDDDGADKEPIKHCDMEFEERAYKYIRLTYDAYVGQKFTIEYFYDSCGGNITAPTIIRPQKHESDSRYADNMNCIWYITAPAEHSIAIRFKYLDMEENYDHISIYTGHLIKSEKRVVKLSGNHSTNAPTIVVDQNQAVINAISDVSNSAKGFEASVVFIVNCNERISLTDGNSPVTLSRNIKFNSTEEYICNYRISAPKGYRILVDIKRLQINSVNSTSCQNPRNECDKRCNYFEIFDGISAQQASIGKFCSAPNQNISILSSYENAVLNLNANIPGQYNLEIILTMTKSACDALFDYKLKDNETYKLTFPQNGIATYEPNTHCAWRLSSDNFKLQVHINYLDLQNTSQVTGKCLDYLQIKGVYDSNYLCGSIKNYTFHTFRSYDNNVDLAFHSDDTVEGKGFELTIQRAYACNRTYTLLSDSINYNGYTKYIEMCNDTILVPENYTLNLYISVLYFKNYDSEKSYLKITDLKTNKTLLNRHQNSYIRVNLFTTTNSIRIETADYSTVALNYIASDRNLIPGCGGSLYSDDGQFSSPLYENDRNFSECRWNIVVPSPNYIKIEFYEFNMGTATNCHTDNVKLIEILPDKSEKLLKTLCGPEIPEYTSSTSNHVVLISKKSPNFDGIGWTVHYSVLQKNDDSNNLIQV